MEIYWRLLHQVAEVDLGGATACSQARSQLAWGVVDDSLVEVAAIEVIAVDAMDHAGVVGAAVDAGRVGRVSHPVESCAAVERLLH